MCRAIQSNLTITDPAVPENIVHTSLLRILLFIFPSSVAIKTINHIISGQSQEI